MAAHPPVRMPSSEWGGKDRPVYYRSPSSQLRHQQQVSRAGEERKESESEDKNPFAAASSGSGDANTNPPANPAGFGVKNSVGSAIESVSETVKPYLPESIAAYLPTSTTTACELPSKEVPSGSRMGVGSLPGCTSETSVAKLPDERMMEARESGHKVHRHHHHHHQKHAGPAAAGMYQTAKNYIRRSVGAYLPGGGTAHASELPSKETPGGSAVGVGSLPGTTSEVSVAKLPEERRLEGLPSHETDHEVLGKSGGVGALPGGPNESRVAMLPEERVHPQSEVLAAGSPLKKTIEHEERTRVPGGFEQEGHAGHRSSQGAGDAGFGGTTAHPDVRLDPGYHPAALHPIDPKFKEKKSQVPQASYASAAAGDTSRRSPESERSSSSSGERKKTGFMKKVKGEVKVISGKLSHNEKKIEEGKQLKGK